MSARIVGEESLLKKFRTIPVAVRGSIREALEEQAEEVVAMMRRLAPSRTGTLRESIGWRWGSKAPTGTMAIATVGSEQSEDLTITIFAGGKVAGNDAFYARFVEFGTVKMTARPFFYVSWRANKKRVRSRVQAAMRRAARKAAAL
jgi:HK97 gp10 family phage protein